MPPKSLAYKFFKQRILILVHTKDSPSDAEWGEYLQNAKHWRDRIEGFLVVTEGGGPNTLQRGEMNDVLEAEKRGGKTAVVTLSRIARGIVTALSWFNPGIKAFSTIHIPAALDYLGVAKADHDLLISELKRLKSELGIVDAPP
jgi:hypothetical protein